METLSFFSCWLLFLQGFPYEPGPAQGFVLLKECFSRCFTETLKRSWFYGYFIANLQCEIWLLNHVTWLVQSEDRHWPNQALPEKLLFMSLERKQKSREEWQNFEIWFRESLFCTLQENSSSCWQHQLWRLPAWHRPPAFTTLLFFFCVLFFFCLDAQSSHWIFVDCAWGGICHIVLKAPSSGDAASLYWFSLTLSHLEVLPHRAQDGAGHWVYRRGSNWELPGPRPSQDAGGGQHPTGGSSSSAALRFPQRTNKTCFLPVI